ncbi:ParA family protein [Hydrogenimonas thermophila]|uniref:Chromosome partitioning protein n=1 Tax=Hydrogenimonas thermophila TaxID=223786 RepID=A0A1I5N7I3_9BACT|nr:ParA family protein [Hydrogenimonas thermophila]SFP17875.1 chromosome partitioning protein [Hydrogenimonas thermophila]
MILTLSHQKGGVGKSTIAWNLAFELSKNIDVKVIDLDIQQSLSVANDIRVNSGLPSMPIEKIESPDRLTKLIQNDTDDQLIIIDSGGFDSSFNRIAIVASDMIITPISDKPFDLMGLKKYEEILQTLSDIQKETIQSHVIFNSINPSMRRFEELIEFVESSKHFKPLKTILRQRVDYANSIGSGKTVCEYKPASKAAQEILALAKEVKELLNIF